MLLRVLLPLTIGLGTVCAPGHVFRMSFSGTRCSCSVSFAPCSQRRVGAGGVVSGKGALRRPEAFVRPARDDRRSATFDRSESKQKKRLKRAGVVECRKEPRVTFCGFRGCVFVHDYYY